MNTAVATRIARLRLSYGHYADGNDTWVHCPHCREQIRYIWSPLDHVQPHTSGAERLLREQLVKHLTSGDCTGAD